MTTRSQNLRSSTPGQTPAAGTRQPGEIWMTFPDLQLGYIDAARNAQKALAVRFFSALANYAAGDFVFQAGQLYRAKAAVTAGAFNATQWTQLAVTSDIPAIYVLPIATPTVLGGVKPDGVTTKVDGATGVLSAAGLVAVSATPPSPVQNGALWYDLVGGQLYAWVNDGTSSQWVIAVNQMLADGAYLPISGGVLSGPLTVPSSTSPTTAGLVIDGVNVSNRSIMGATNGSPRWRMTFGGGVAESGANAGSDWSLQRYDDSGAVLGGAVMYADRKTGAVHMLGVTDGSDAAPGQIGEIISSINTTGATILTNVQQNITSIPLTPGDWEVWGEAWFGGATTITAVSAGITGGSGVLPTLAPGTSRAQISGTLTGAQLLSLAPCRVSVANPITFYLVCWITYSTGTCTNTGKIFARRAR